MRWLVAAVAIAIAAFFGPAASACSMSGSPQELRETIRNDDSLRKIEGTFRIEGKIEWPDEYGAHAIVRGLIESKTGRTYPVRFEYNEFWVQCGLQFTPPLDATGTFWITRRSRDDRYEMMLWEGEYTPEALERYHKQTEGAASTE